MKTIIDVRTKPEFDHQHIKGAINLSVGDILAGELPDLPKTASVGLYCRTGNRSSFAKDLLTNAGYSGVENLGGIEDVRRLGYDLE